MQIIHEDNHIIIVNKACSEIVQGDKTGDLTLIDKVRLILKKNIISRAMFFLVWYTV